MKIVYYSNSSSQVTPVKQFLMKYYLKPTDSQKQKIHKVKILAFIDQTIKFIFENKGKPTPPTAKTIKGYKFHEMRIKDGSTLIRILYFCYLQEKLVLLNVFEKPEFYEKKLKKKIRKQINQTLEKTQEYYQDFIKNQTYEEYK